MRYAPALFAALILVGCSSGQDKAKRPDAPFGIAMGDLIPDIEIGSTPDARGYAVMRSVPKPEEPFVDYAVIVRENIGVCRVMAASGNFAVSNDDAVRDRMNGVRARIEARYGKPAQILDSCAGGKLCAGDVWSQAIARGVRQYAFIWGGNGTMVTPNIKEIRLEARTNEVLEPYVRLDYTFANAAACAAAPPKNG